MNDKIWVDFVTATKRFTLAKAEGVTGLRLYSLRMDKHIKWKKYLRKR